MKEKEDTNPSLVYLQVFLKDSGLSARIHIQGKVKKVSELNITVTWKESGPEG